MESIIQLIERPVSHEHRIILPTPAAGSPVLRLLSGERGYMTEAGSSEVAMYDIL
jgi:hypothetical protein